MLVVLGAATLGRLDLPLPSSQRMGSLQAGRRLADEIVSKSGTELVNAVAELPLPTSAEAVGIAIAQSGKLKAAIDCISWPLLDTVKAIKGSLETEAISVLGTLKAAATADEHAAPLKTAIDAFNRDAASLVARALPDRDPIRKTGRRIVKQGSRQNLDPASARRLLEEIERDAGGARKASVEIVWTIDEPDQP